MANKILPLDRTLVTEFKVQVADIHTRVKFLNGSIAAKVPQDSSYASGDFVVGPGQDQLITNIKVAVLLYGFEPFLIDLSTSQGQLMGIACNGLFIMYGSFDSCLVRSSKSIRLTYMWA